MATHDFNNPPTSENWFRIKEDLEHIDAVVDEDKPRDVPKPGGGSRPNIAKGLDQFNRDLSGVLAQAEYAGRLAQINARSALTRGVLTFWPSVEAARSQGVTAVFLENAGEGGQDGIYTLRASGGNPAVPAALRVSIENGSVEAVLIDYPGHGYQSAPTLDFSLVPDIQNVDAEASLGTNVPTAAYFTVADEDSFTVYVNRENGASKISSYASVEKVQKAVDVIDANSSADVAQTIDQGGAPVKRVDRNGRVVAPGAPAGLQNAFAGQSLSKYHALLHWRDTYGRDVPQRNLLYNLWRAQHEAGAPIKRNVQIVAPDDSGAKLQRLPCCAEVRPGVVFVANSQVGPNGPNSDTDGLRLVGRFVYIDLSTGHVNAIGPAIVIDEPDGYDQGTGSSAPESVFVRDNGDVVVIFKYISDTLGKDGVDRDVCQRTVSPDGTVGARTRIVNGADWDNLLGTANGTAVVLRSGPFAGRWVFPIYFYPTADGRRLNTVYTDDQADSWSFGEPITDSAGFNEWAFAQQPDGSLVGSARSREQRHPRLYCPPKGGGASGWEVSDLDYSAWYDHQNNRSVEQLSLDPSDGVPGLVWSSTIPINSTNYANSGTEYGRRNLGLRISFDGLVTLSHEYTFDIADSPAGYSDIMRLSNGMYLTVFETGFNSPPVHIRAYIFNLSEVIQHGYPV